MSSAVQSFPFGILKTAATNDYHAPLFQLIVHFFTYFDNEWIYIRLFNAFLSVLNVYIFYKIGSLVKDKNTGYISALVLAVNHLAISTASFVKFYALAFLLISINIYYFIKILKYNSGYNKFAVCNILFILTSTYGFIFIFLEYLYLLISKRNKNLYKSILISSIGFILYLPVLLVQIKTNFSNIFSPHGYYSEFAPISLYNALNDYFAPFLNYCCNIQTIAAFTLLLKFIKSGQIHYLLEFIVFSAIPVIIALFFIFKSIYKNKYVRQINIISLSFLIVFIIMTKLELTGFISIYIYPFALISLISIGCGVLICNKRKIAIGVFVIYILINLSILNSYPADKRDFFRAKIYGCIEQYYKDNENVKLVVTSGGRFLKKYYKQKVIFDFDSEKINGVFQREYISLIFGKEVADKINKINAFELLKPLIINKYRNPDFEKYFIKNVYDKLQKNETVTLCFTGEENYFLDKYDDYVLWLNKMPYNPHLSKADFKFALSDYETVMDTAVLGQIINSHSYEYLIDLFDKYFKRVKFEQYTKTNNDKWIKNFEDTTDTYSTLYLAQNTTKSWIFVTYKKE